jgi:hypothetical protein
MRGLTARIVLALFLVSCQGILPGSETPNDEPEIISFTAEPSAITLPGQEVTLSWVVTNADTLEIAADSLPDLGTVIGTSVSVFPEQDVAYTLRATNSAGSFDATTHVRLQVDEPQPEPEPDGPALEYLFETNCGQGGLLTYATVEGGTRQEYRGGGKVYEAYGPFPRSNPFVYISAQNQCARGYVTVTIRRFGEVFLTETSRGAYVIATASGSFGD